MNSYCMSLSSLRLDLRSAPIVPLGTPPYEDPLPHSLSSGLEWRKISGNDCSHSLGYCRWVTGPLQANRRIRFLDDLSTTDGILQSYY
jgi:hypothetical protein